MRSRAIEALSSQLDLVGNPAALHRAGQRARRVLEEAREQLASALGAHPTEVIFTSGGSEANSIAVLGGSMRQRATGRNRTLVSAVEHPAVLGAKDQGAEIIPVDSDGRVDIAAAQELFDEEVGIVSVMQVNNETGIVQPLDELVAACGGRGAWLHSDAVQALGHVPVNFARQGLDMLSVSAHKVGGPVGVGALVAKRDVKPRPIGLGGGQEREIRSGTAMAGLASSFAAAADEAVAELAAETDRLLKLKQELVRIVSESGGIINAPGTDSAPHILNATFPGIKADDLLFLLDFQGVYASVGSACRAGVHQPSEVLLAMGRSVEEATASIRLSTGHTTTAQDVARVARVLPTAVAQARNVPDSRS